MLYRPHPSSLKGKENISRLQIFVFLQQQLSSKTLYLLTLTTSTAITRSFSWSITGLQTTEKIGQVKGECRKNENT